MKDWYNIRLLYHDQFIGINYNSGEKSENFTLDHSEMNHASYEIFYFLSAFNS